MEEGKLMTIQDVKETLKKVLSMMAFSQSVFYVLNKLLFGNESLAHIVFFSKEQLDHHRKDLDKITERLENTMKDIKNYIENGIEGNEDKQSEEQIQEGINYVIEMKEYVVKYIIKYYIEVYVEMIGYYIEMKFINLYLIPTMINFLVEVDGKVSRKNLDNIHRVASYSNPKTVITGYKRLIHEEEYRADINSILNEYENIVNNSFDIAKNCILALTNKNIKNIVGDEFFENEVINKFISFHNANRFFVLPKRIVKKRTTESLKALGKEEDIESSLSLSSGSSSSDGNENTKKTNKKTIESVKSIEDYQIETEELEKRKMRGKFDYSNIYRYDENKKFKLGKYCDYEYKKPFVYPINVPFIRSPEPLDFNDRIKIEEMMYEEKDDTDTTKDYESVLEFIRHGNKKKSKRKPKGKVSFSETSKIYEIPNKENKDDYLLG